MEDIKLEIPRVPDDQDPISLNLKNGDQVFIVGPNGSGKSALMQRIVSELPPDKVKRITAHRKTWFNSGSIDLTPANRQQYEKQNRDYDRKDESRWREYNSEWTLSTALFDLVAKENTRARTITRHADNNNYEKVKESSAESISPFNQINKLLSLARLMVTIENSNDQVLLARYSTGQSFSIAEMSDGERNAMIIAAQVITADPGTIFLIDEPDKHLHRSITQPFFSALFDLRKEDCIFIIATHDIGLPTVNAEARVLMLRSCQWNSSKCISWDAQVLEPNSQLSNDLKLSEELKHDILGSRKKILFVEGSSDSLDLKLYEILFSDVSVVPKGSCEEVQKAVIGLRDSQDIHHVEAFGLIDRDNREDEDVKELNKKGIFALEVYAVESLYYCSDSIAAIADQQAKSLNEHKNTLIEAANKQAIDDLKKHAERMSARRCERQVKESMSKSLNWETIIDNTTQSIEISINNPFTGELKHFNQLVEEENIDKLIDRYSVRESGAFELIAKSLRCPNKKDYEQRVITQIRRDNELAEKLKKRIGPLSSRLEQIETLETL